MAAPGTRGAIQLAEALGRRCQTSAVGGSPPAFLSALDWAAGRCRRSDGRWIESQINGLPPAAGPCGYGENRGRRGLKPTAAFALASVSGAWPGIRTF